MSDDSIFIPDSGQIIFTPPQGQAIFTISYEDFDMLSSLPAEKREELNRRFHELIKELSGGQASEKQP